MSKCLNLVRKKRNNVASHKLLWGPLPVPRRSFIALLSILNSLSTKSRQLRRGRNIDTTCSLFQQAPEDRDHFQVQQAPEDRDHLFFSCSFTKKIWQCFLKKSGICRLAIGRRSWIVPFLFNRRILRCSCVYQIWKERNMRAHGFDGTVASVIVHRISSFDKLRLYKTKIYRKLS
ncbi:hypothetical protein NC651_028900 [Populus alba x Populus x berolinensis]|nr:hypothetical protein NC651_028900 [Populus alba x Populus x berolinensis]